MINPVSFSGISMFGTGSVQVQPPSPHPYTDGYLAGEILPAQHWNWLLKRITSDDSLNSVAINHLIAELDNLVIAGGMAITPSDDTQVLKMIVSGAIQLTTGSSPYSLVAFSTPALVINATTNPYIVNLPAAIGSGYRVKIVNVNVAVAGLVRITPNGTDKIGPAGNVSIYLQNTDQGGNLNYFQEVDLLDALSGYWVVTGGVYAPHQTVDADGSQYHLGKPHHLPLGNTTSRQINLGWNASSFSSAFTAAGNYGVPLGAKGIRARLRVLGASNGAGLTEAIIALSDNNSSVPTIQTAHPQGRIQFTATAVSQVSESMTEVDIPLNGSGQFYAYGLLATNIGSPSAYAIVVGFYMGD